MTLSWVIFLDTTLGVPLVLGTNIRHFYNIRITSKHGRAGTDSVAMGLTSA